MRKKVKTSDVKIANRVRYDMGKIEELAESIEKFGIIHPPVVDEEMNIIAGGRRFTAMRDILKLEEIEVDVLQNTDEITRRELELEENIQRKDLTWQEELAATKELHELKIAIHGPRVKGIEVPGRWGVQDTADTIDRTKGSVSMDLKLAEGIEQYPEIADEPNKFQAMKKLKQLEEEAILRELSSREVDIEQDYVNLVQGDCLEELRKIPENSIALAVTDPPWGVGMDKNSQLSRKTTVEYDDSTEESLELIRLCAKELYRVLAEDSHLFMFCAITHLYSMIQSLEDAGFEVDPIPAVWVKEGGGSPAKGFSLPSAYEIFLHAWKGRRELNSGRSNVFQFNRVPSAQKVHSAQKPEALLEEIIELASDPGDTVVDCFAGSGATAIAAARRKRKAICIEKSPANFARMREHVNEFLIQEGVDRGGEVEEA